MRDRILKELMQAMKEQDKDTLSVLRMIKGSMQLEEIKVGHQLDDTEMAVLINKEIKTRKESITEFQKGNREDLVSATQKEIEILNKYLPKQMTTEEIMKEVDKVFDELKPESIREMGKIMGALTPILKGKADMGEVSKIIKEKLGA